MVPLQYLMQQSIHDSYKTTCPSTLPLDYPSLHILLLLHILLQKEKKKKEKKKKEEDSTQKQLNRNFYLSHIKARADREGGVLSSPNLEQMNKIRYLWCAAASRADRA